jgi:hypothetical protein
MDPQNNQKPQNSQQPLREQQPQTQQQSQPIQQTEGHKKGKFSRSWQLVKASASGVNKDKEVVVLVVIEQIAILLAAALLWYLFFASPFRSVLYNASASGTYESNTTPIGWAVFIIFGIIITTMSSLVEGAVCSAAFDRFSGKNPTLGTCTSSALKKFVPLSMFSVVTFAVRFAASKASEGSNNVGAKSIAKLANTAWNIMTYFSIPIIMQSKESVGPVNSIKYSINVLKKNWGESLIANFGVGFIQTIVILVLLMIFAPIGFIILSSGASLTILIAVGIIFILILASVSLFFSVLSIYVKTALFYYVQFNKTPEVFSNSNLAGIFSVKN